MLGDFFWNDDFPWIEAIRQTPPGTLLWSAFVYPYYSSAIRPIAFLWFGLLVPVCGCEPTGYRAGALALHIVNGLLVYAFGRRLIGDRWLALAATLVWFIYPVHRWAVLWIADIADPFLVLFSLSSLLWFWRYLDQTRAGQSGKLSYSLALIAFTLALLSKESSITLAFLFPALEWLTRRPGDARGGLKRTWRTYLPFFVLTGVYLVVEGMAYQYRPGVESYALLSPRRAVENLSKALIFLVAPLVHPNTLNTMQMRVGAVVAGVLASLWGLAVWRWARREGWFLSAWVAITMLPIILASSFFAPSRGRYLYIVSIGYILLLALLAQSAVKSRWAVPRQWAAYKWPLATGALAIVLIGLGVFNADQQRFVRDDPINALRRWTRGGLMGCPVTEAMRARERSWEEADFRRAAQSFDQLALQVPLTAIDILSRGLAYELAGDPDRAAANYRAGLALVPATGYDNRNVNWGDYWPYERIASYVQTRLDALERTTDGGRKTEER